MDDDTIYRSAAIGEITEYGDSNIVYMSVGELKRRLEQLPPAQSEQKKGKWIDNTYCSECGWVHETDPGFIGSVDGFNFCPRCGADMRGEHDG